MKQLNMTQTNQSLFVSYYISNVLHACLHALKLYPYMDAWIYKHSCSVGIYCSSIKETGLQAEANQEGQESARLQLYSGSPL